MKAVLRRILTPKQRRQMRQFSEQLVERTSLVLAGLIRSLPLALAAATKEKLVLVGKLDYADTDIWLHVDSALEFALRLNACRKEPETVSWIRDYIKPGEIVYDVGANVGAYSLIIALATGRTTRIYAFEPSPTTLHKLQQNIILNGCEASIVPVAISLADATATEAWHYSSLTPGAARHSLGAALDAKGESFVPIASQMVMTCRMDDLTQIWRIAKPNHIKLDTDGSELRILQGAGKLLSEPSLRSILVEVEPSCQTANDIQALLIRHGLEMKSSHSHGPSSDATTNVIFARPGPTEKISAC